MAFLKRNIDIILIVLIGFVLRFTVSIIHSYSNDELSAVSRLRYSNFSDLIEFGVQKGDMHPAGVQIFMKGWSLLVGKSEMAMRFPFVLFGTASILLLFLIGKQWFNRKVGLIAAALLSVLYFPIMNSEFARPYSPGLLISLLVGYFLYRILFDEDKKWRNAIILGFCFAAGMYTHYFSFLFVGFMGATGLIYLSKKNWKYLVVAGGLGILLFTPHLGVTDYHLSVGGLQWLPAPSSGWLIQFLFHAFNESWIVIFCLFGLVLYALFGIKKWETVRTRNTYLIGLWFFGIFIIGFILSYISTPVLKFPVMLFAFPYFLLLIGILLARISRINVLLGGILIIGISSTVIEKDLYGNQHYALFKETGIKIAEWENEYGEENIYTVYNLNNPGYINFYADEWGGDSIEFDWSILEFDSDIELRKDLMKRDEEYCVLGFSSRLTLVQVFETVREFYPIVVDYQPCNNGNLFLMKKGVEVTPFAKIEKVIDFTEKNKSDWKMEASQVTSNGVNCEYKLDSNHIYGPTYSFKLGDLPKIEHAYLKVVIEANLEEGAQLVVSLSGERGGEVLQHRGENMWIGHHLEDMINSTPNKTGYFAFQIPDFIVDSDILKIGLWNFSGKEITVQKFEIYYVENKWN